jgi:phosphomannomutase
VVDIGLVDDADELLRGRLPAHLGGVQTTASHNPAQYNGFKFSKKRRQAGVRRRGHPGNRAPRQAGDLAAAPTPGKLRSAEVFAAYGDRVLSFLARPANARPLKVVVDAGNGMSTIYRPLLERTGIELVPLYFELDGTFPNHEANPLKLENLRDLCAEVKRTGADLGVSFDGDADRAASSTKPASPWAPI